MHVLSGYCSYNEPMILRFNSLHEKREHQHALICVKPGILTAHLCFSACKLPDGMVLIYHSGAGRELCAASQLQRSLMERSQKKRQVRAAFQPYVMANVRDL